MGSAMATVLPHCCRVNPSEFMASARLELCTQRRRLCVHVFGGFYGYFFFAASFVLQVGNIVPRLVNHFGDNVEPLQLDAGSSIRIANNSLPTLGRQMKIPRTKRGERVCFY